MEGILSMIKMLFSSLFGSTQATDFGPLNIADEIPL